MIMKFQKVSLQMEKYMKLKILAILQTFFKFMTMTIKEKTLSKDFKSSDFINGINEDYEKIVKDRD